ncbi:SMC-Scp complex subunit ScpB [Ancylobacter amanitiformis]|uniref:Segregation and condensation protein B n=1 Tax=Ancylobacter amanitiformis TaxID=217069 RepID=A0ABU0LUB5_9HYPH|nr:SMC-Scp complex subunit ScpB [Ancylobacter amanitiformis]MDQ0512303.1 segregation and condensation protein B [Ancylobacter amanitiformis]
MSGEAAREPQPTREPAPAPHRPTALRLVEAMLFAAGEPLDEATLMARLPEGADVRALLAELAADYAPRGVNLVRVAGKWMLRTAPDLGFLLARDKPEPRRLSRAALETLAIIAYHQPATRAEIEEIRGVSTNKGTLDVLLAAGWVRLRGRRRSPGRPVTYGTTETFLVHFGLDSIRDLPGLDELRGTGLIDARVSAGLTVPLPNDDAALQDDEDPLEPDFDLSLAPEPDSEPEGEEGGDEPG